LLAAALHGPSRAGADEVAFSIPIAAGTVPRSQRVLRVPHESLVRIEWSADRPMTVHLEGYDISVAAAPEKPAIMQFKAFASGRFPVHAHGGEQRGRHAHGRGALLWLEVHPK
jgi:hypothetical protein